MTQDIKDSLLNAKDERIKKRQAFSRNHATTIALSVNQPGWPKNTQSTRIILKIFDHLITKMFKITGLEHYRSLAGDTVFYGLNTHPKEVKNQSVYIETNHPLGRFIDIDIYDANQTYTRQMMTLPQRQCYLCDAPAHACAAMQKHSVETLRTTLDKRVKIYLLDALSEAAAMALRKELALYPKFGLVSFHDSGVHTDMHAGHFLTSIEAIKPYFKDLIAHGLQSIDVDHLRELGKHAEHAMFEATNDINTHKGAIFIFGSFLPFYTQAILEDKPFSEALKKMQEAMRELIAYDVDKINEEGPASFGEQCYVNYGILGIRGEVKNGFPSIQSWYKKHPYNDYQKLLKIASVLDDTTIIKRTNYETLRKFQYDCKQFLKTPFSHQAYTNFSDYYRNYHVSPGGAADILALSFFLEMTDFLLKNSP